jgi:hypothetical protein
MTSRLSSWGSLEAVERQLEEVILVLLAEQERRSLTG